MEEPHVRPIPSTELNEAADEVTEREAKDGAVSHGVALNAM